MDLYYWTLNRLGLSPPLGNLHRISTVCSSFTSWSWEIPNFICFSRHETLQRSWLILPYPISIHIMPTGGFCCRTSGLNWEWTGRKAKHYHYAMLRLELKSRSELYITFPDPTVLGCRRVGSMSWWGGQYLNLKDHVATLYAHIFHRHKLTWNCKVVYHHVYHSGCQTLPFWSSQCHQFCLHS